MSQVRCPNCRAERAAEDEGCSHCGWLPLRATELQFVGDGERLACPDCGASRQAADPVCPQCGSTTLLASPAPPKLRFGIGSLMGVTALVAVCVAIGRVFLAGGVLLFLLFGFSTVRVALLAQQRYRYGYPVSNRDLGRWFGVSVVGLIGGGLAFGLTCLLGTMGLGVAGSVLPGRGVDRIFLVGMLVTVMNAAAVAWATRLPPEQRRLAWLGAGTGGFSAGLVVLALRTLTPVFAPLIMLPLLSGSAGLFYLTCIPGPVRRLMAYSIGFFTATSAWGWCGYLSPQGFPVQDMERSLLFLGLFLPPTLLTLLVMSGIWSWDDAFPETRATAANTPDRPHPAGILLMESAEGIEFLGDSDRLAEAGPKPPGPEQTSASEPPRQREETD